MKKGDEKLDLIGNQKNNNITTLANVVSRVTLETSNWSQKKYNGDSIAPRGSLRTKDQRQRRACSEMVFLCILSYQIVQTTFLYKDLVQIVP